MLDQVASLEHGDLGHPGAHLDAHEVATDRLAVALAAAALLERGGVEFAVVANDPCRALGPAGSSTNPPTRRRNDPRSGDLRRRPSCDPSRPSTRIDVGASGYRRAVAPPSRIRGGCRTRRRRGGHRHRVADPRLAHERLLGRLGRRPPLAHRLGQFDVVAVVDRGGCITGGATVATARATCLAAATTLSTAGAATAFRAGRAGGRACGRVRRRGVRTGFGRTLGVGVIHGRSGPFWHERPRRRSAWLAPSARCSGDEPIVYVGSAG